MPDWVKTRRVAMCLWTHCNIGPKRACCPLASDVEPWTHWTVHLLAVPEVSNRARNVVCSMSVSPSGEWRWNFCFCKFEIWNFTEISSFRGLIAPKPYVPHQNSLTKGTSLGCRLGPETIAIARTCAVWTVALS